MVAAELETYDVVVVGGGNAALCAAISARESGARVLVLERAPEAERGGNTHLTDGLMRVVYNGVEDIRQLAPDLSDDEVAITDFGTYTAEDFYTDMGRITRWRTDPELCEVLVENSFETLLWMRDHGVRFMPNYGRQAFKVDGRFRFWGGATIVVAEGGPGLVDSLYRAAEKQGIEVRYGAWVQQLTREPGRVTGVVARTEDDDIEVRARAVILACGGFEANAEWRTKYLGPGWDLARVRGSRYNTGDGLAMALDAGAQPYGHWSGCHATAWERNALDFGDPIQTPTYQRHSYTFGIVVNSEGQRFIDEGEDFRNYTYAKYGEAILRQPGQIAWQVFDAKSDHLLRDEYRTRGASKVEADTIEELAGKLVEVDGDALIQTVQEFNEAVRTDVPFDPNVKDGRSADGLAVRRSNWANRIDEPPFVAYSVTCGITFTFGGIRVTPRAEVVDSNGNIIDGLFAAGEMVGGLFYHNYPGATGLTSGAVFGRTAGRAAAQRAEALALASS